MLLALLLACSGASSVPSTEGRPTPTFTLSEPSGSVAWRALAALDDATFHMPPAAQDPRRSVEPSGGAVDGTFRLDGPWEEDGRRIRRLRAWTHPLPFTNDMKRPNYAPWGARLYTGGRELPFVNQLEDLSEGGGWLIEEDRLVLLGMEAPVAGVHELRAPELAEALARREYDPASGKAPRDFVRTEVTLGGITRVGLHLPAAAGVEFRLEVPQDATLRFGLAPLPDPRAAATRDGSVVARVRIDGEVIDETTVDARAEHTERSVSLSSHAGRTVTLRLEAEAVLGSGPPGHVVFTAPSVRASTSRPPRRVVVVGVDTLRQDALSAHGAAADRSPELDVWARQFAVFENAYAPAPRTRPSFRTAFTGRYPLAAPDAATLAEHLAAQGFRTGGVVANVHLVPRFGFNEGFEYWNYENGARADVEVDRALAWLDAHQDEDTFLFLHLMDPHTWYNAPEPWGSKFTAGPRPEIVPPTFDRWQVYSLMRRRGFDDRARSWIRGAYEGEVAYTSAELSRFLSALDDLPGETLTVVHSDHGEELWDHGAFEHNHSLYDELVRAVLWIRPPGGWAGGPHRIQAPVGLIDIVPTVLDLVGAPLADSESDGTSLRPFVDAARFDQRDALTQRLGERPLQLGHLMFGTERWGVVHRGHKYILHTASGREELYDLGTDRGESRNLADKADPALLADMRAALGRATGWPVHGGWRITLQRGAVPLTFTFDGPVADAGVIDPEAARDLRANLEWGESPKLPVAAVGSMSVEPDRRVVRFSPGPEAVGQTLWIACADACPAGTVRAGVSEVEQPFAEGRLAIGPGEVRITAGTLLLPAASQAAAIPAPSDAQIEALRQLGYLDGD